jgi:hypothetical protein
MRLPIGAADHSRSTPSLPLLPSCKKDLSSCPLRLCGEYDFFGLNAFYRSIVTGVPRATLLKKICAILPGIRMQP